jgi:hypothetical protein
MKNEKIIKLYKNVGIKKPRKIRGSLTTLVFHYFSFITFLSIVASPFTIFNIYDPGS